MTALPFWAPLALLGFAPWMILTQQAISLIYQFWIHTERVKRLPAPIEFVFNTPSHHRVHHGSNEVYLDRNYGGILIIWDRIFGTFQGETERVRYGLTQNIRTFRPTRVAFHEFVAMARDVRGRDELARPPRLRLPRPGLVARRPRRRHPGLRRREVDFAPIWCLIDVSTRIPLSLNGSLRAGEENCGGVKFLFVPIAIVAFVALPPAAGRDRAGGLDGGARDGREDLALPLRRRPARAAGASAGVTAAALLTTSKALPGMPSAG